MWKDYSVSYIKNNRSSSISVMAASLIATLFLSLLCSLFYNFEVYEVERIILKEGDWQGRLTGDIHEDDLSLIQNFANVEQAVINEELSGVENTVVDVYFHNARQIFHDMPIITKHLGLEENAAEYHLLLLSRFLIHDPQDEEPPLLLTFYLVLLIMVSLSLIFIIRNSFAVSMHSRVHQFGIFSSIGATPKQIRTCLLQEAAVLCTVPILLGSLFGIAISYGVIKAINILAADVVGRHEAVYQYHPLVFAITILSSVVTVLLSAWMPARKLSRLTPLDAIRDAGELHLKRKNQSRILSMLFGMEGELAGNALKVQKKALRTSTLSLVLSFLGFTMMLCFFTLSGISTEMTYYMRYQHAWDVMVTVKNTEIGDFGLAGELQDMKGIRNSIVYQKEEAVTPVLAGEQSKELLAVGGLETIAGITESEKGYLPVKAPIVILDDAGFIEYCKEIGIAPKLDGAIVLNQIWDSVNSNFRHPKNIPFINESRETTTLCQIKQDGQGVEIPVSGYTQTVPNLREEYDNYALVHFIPLSLWKEISSQIGGAEKETFIRILGKEGIALSELNVLQEEVSQMIGKGYEIECENRIQGKLTNDKMIQGSQLILGAFCSLLALIGIANVFSNTLGFLRQRKREFAQYMSVGMTPAGMRKMFCIEALVIAGRPLLITLPLTVAFVIFGVKASHLELVVFWVEAPIMPVIIFSLTIFFFVALAYYIGGKRLLECDLSDVLRNDTMI